MFLAYAYERKGKPQERLCYTVTPYEIGDIEQQRFSPAIRQVTKATGCAKTRGSLLLCRLLQPLPMEFARYWHLWPTYLMWLDWARDGRQLGKAAKAYYG